MIFGGLTALEVLNYSNRAVRMQIVCEWVRNTEGHQGTPHLYSSQVVDNSMSYHCLQVKLLHKDR